MELPDQHRKNSSPQPPVLAAPLASPLADEMSDPESEDTLPVTTESTGELAPPDNNTAQACEPNM